MAYSRFRRSGNYRRRVRRGVRRYRRRFRRGARRYMRRSMSRRKVADISSSKMRDNMAATPIADGGAEGEIGDPAIITSEASAAILFCPSARGAQWSEGESEYSRQKTEVYAKGYLENVTIETIGPGNWRWRRIVFQCHSQDIISTYPQNTMANYDNANGYKRAMLPITSGSSNIAGYQAVLRQLFQGTLGYDYGDVYVAPVDRNRNRVLMDRSMPVRSGNSKGIWKNQRDYVAINKKLRYDEKEQGQGKEPLSDVIAGRQNYTWFTTPTRYTGGDVYVFDLFSCADTSDGGVNQLHFRAHGTWYWHER